MTRTAEVRLWIDPSCPWSWQTSIWLRELRDRGLVILTYSLFSLELNTTRMETPDAPFDDAAPTYGLAIKALALARREEGDPGLERLHVALGSRLHDAREDMTTDLLVKAALEAGSPDLLDRAAADPSLADELVAEYDSARARSVFGVPTIEIDGSEPLYGPILPVAPTGDDALEWWIHVHWLTTRPDFFELKRWPRNLRPG